MFVRTKKIKNQDYAYLVRNKWTRKGTRQKVNRYLGRVVTPEQVLEVSYNDHMGDNESLDRISARELVKSLVAWVLHNHGFTQKKNRFFYKGITVDLSKLQVRCGRRNIALNINNDFLCGYTLRRLLRFKSGKSQDAVGLQLAKAFIGSGIPIPQDVFVHVFEKVYKRGQSFVR